MTNAMILILTLLISRFRMATFLVPLLMVFTFLNLFGMPEYLVIRRTSMFVTKLLQQEYPYHKLRKALSKLYHRHYEFISKYDTGLKTLLQQGLSELEFYPDLVYKFR